MLNSVTGSSPGLHCVDRAARDSEYSCSADSQAEWITDGAGSRDSHVRHLTSAVSAHDLFTAEPLISSTKFAPTTCDRFQQLGMAFAAESESLSATCRLLTFRCSETVPCRTASAMPAASKRFQANPWCASKIKEPPLKTGLRAKLGLY